MVALAVMVRQKEVVEHLHEYRVVCSYDELKRFRSSVAFHASSANNSSILRHHSEGLVQAVADNFDCNISSMNGLRQTHSLALMMIQHGREAVNKDEFIKRLKKADLKDIYLPDVEMSRYTGPKKPCMPENDVHSLVPPLKVLCGAVISENVNSEFDFMFLKSIAETPDTPEYSGYNTRADRESGRSLGEATSSMYLPLIDSKPADPSTILTAMNEAVRITEETGQYYTIFTCDQQLYKVLVNIKWVYPDKFKNFIPRLGGMHFLMSFIGCCGTLMANSVLLMMLFVRAEIIEELLREGDWPMHLYAVSKMISYLFAAGHHNYARYGLYYLQDMKSLPAAILERFLKGEHVIRHQKGFWNGIWTDMFIETTFMRYGKGPGGLIGLTLKSNVVKSGLTVFMLLKEKKKRKVGTRSGRNR